MTYRLLHPHEIKQIESDMELILSDTLHTWRLTRIEGASASMSCDGNVSMELLRAFDEVASLARKEEKP